MKTPLEGKDHKELRDTVRQSGVLKRDQCAGLARKERNIMQPELFIHTPEGDEESPLQDGIEGEHI